MSHSPTTTSGASSPTHHASAPDAAAIDALERAMTEEVSSSLETALPLTNLSPAKLETTALTTMQVYQLTKTVQSLRDLLDLRTQSMMLKQEQLQAAHTLTRRRLANHMLRQFIRTWRTKRSLMQAHVSCMEIQGSLSTTPKDPLVIAQEVKSRANLRTLAVMYRKKPNQITGLLNERLDALKMPIHGFVSKCTSAERESKALFDRNVALKSKLMDLEKQLDDERQHTETWKRAVDAKVAEMDTLRREITRLREESAELTDKQKKLKAQERAVTQRLKKLEGMSKDSLPYLSLVSVSNNVGQGAPGSTSPANTARRNQLMQQQQQQQQQLQQQQHLSYSPPDVEFERDRNEGTLPTLLSPMSRAQSNPVRVSIGRHAVDTMGAHEDYKDRNDSGGNTPLTQRTGRRMQPNVTVNVPQSHTTAAIHSSSSSPIALSPKPSGSMSTRANKDLAASSSSQTLMSPHSGRRMAAGNAVVTSSHSNGNGGGYHARAFDV